MKLLVIDNYDSFTYNLVHYVEEILGRDVDVKRNDQGSVDEIENYSHIILSPGPGLPKDAGMMPELIQKYAPSKKILGICLGHQAIAETFGAKLYNLPGVYHGVPTPVNLKTGEMIFKTLPAKTDAGRYHSWAVESGSLPSCLEVIATDEQNVIMGIKHREYDVMGIQFHPESILTPCGYTMLENWLKHDV